MADNTPPVSSLEGAALAFAQEPHRYGTIATINPDGTPHLAVIWYGVREDGSILINSKPGRIWPANLLRDPRCTLAVEGGSKWLTIRGEAVAQSDPAQAVADICALAERYREGVDPAAHEALLGIFRSQERISFHIVPRSITVHLEG